MIINNKIVQISEILRVNHAGEYGAKRIYQGQLAVFKDKSIYETISHMQKQEEKHLEYFEKEIVKNHTRPTILYPLWSICGYTLGVVTALMGEKAAMACTEAVEEVISEHYLSQIDILEDSELKEKIIEFRNDELEHHQQAIENGSNDAPIYSLMTNIIKFGCRAAIYLAKKF